MSTLVERLRDWMGTVHPEDRALIADVAELEAENATLKAERENAIRGRQFVLEQMDQENGELRRENANLRASWDELQRDNLRLTDERDKLRRALLRVFPFGGVIADDVPNDQRIEWTIWASDYRAGRSALAPLPSAGETT